MILLWVTLFAPHQVYSLVPVITAPLGEPVTFTCALPEAEVSHRTLYWFKQSPGDALKLIVTQHKFGKPEYTSELSESRSKVDHDNDFINLTIVRTIKEDEGMYHCAVTEWIGNVAWSGMYLFLKGNSQRTNFSIQQPTVSDPVLPGGSVSLQCSVLSQSETKTCPEGHSVYWVRAGPDKYHPEIIYADGNECEESSDLPKSCVYRLPKNISSSDSGTYHCAVAVCGEILFGNGTKVDNQGACTSSQTTGAMVAQLGVVPAVCLVVTACLIFITKKNNCACSDAAVRQKKSINQKSNQDSDERVYSTAVFTVLNGERCAIQDARTSAERIYAAVMAFECY